MNVQILKTQKGNNITVRNRLKASLRNGDYTLRVVGTEATGFKLAAQTDADTVIAFGFVFTKQAEAVAKGQQKYGQKASKVVMPRSKPAIAA